MRNHKTCKKLAVEVVHESSRRCCIEPPCFCCDFVPHQKKKQQKTKVDTSELHIGKSNQAGQGIYWVVCLSGVGWRVGTSAVGGLGTLTHLNEGDIMEQDGRVCAQPARQTPYCFLLPETSSSSSLQLRAPAANLSALRPS